MIKLNAILYELWKFLELKVHYFSALYKTKSIKKKNDKFNFITMKTPTNIIFRVYKMQSMIKNLHQISCKIITVP